MGLTRFVHRSFAAAAVLVTASAAAPLGAGAAPAGASAHHVAVTAAGGASLGQCRFSVPLVASPGYRLDGSSGTLSSATPGTVTCTVVHGTASWTAHGTIGIVGTYGAGLASIVMRGGTCAADTGFGTLTIVVSSGNDSWSFSGSYQRLAAVDQAAVLLGALGSQPYVGVDTLSGQNGNCITTTLTRFTESGMLSFAPPGTPNLLP